MRLLSRRKLPFNTNVECFYGDLLDPKIELNDFIDGADILCHCAGEVDDETLMRKLHVDGTQRLVDLAKGKIGRWVQLSSMGAYGACRNGVLTEDSLEQPYGTYEQTKTEADEIIKRSGIPFVILRPSNVFGSSMSNNSLFDLIEMLRKGFFFTLAQVTH